MAENWMNPHRVKAVNNERDQLRKERDLWKDKYLKLAYHITQYSNDPGLVDDARAILRESEIKDKTNG